MRVPIRFQSKAALQKTRSELASSSQEAMRVLGQGLVDSGASDAEVVSTLAPLVELAGKDLGEMDGLILRKSSITEINQQLALSRSDLETYRLKSELSRRKLSGIKRTKLIGLFLLAVAFFIFAAIMVLATSNK